MSTDTDMERTGRTTRMVAEAVAAAASHGTVYIVAAHAMDALRIARMVADAVGGTPDRPPLEEVGWSDGYIQEVGALGGHIRVVTLDYRWLDTRGPKWRIIGSDAPLSVDHYAGEVWARRPRPVAP